MPLRNYREFATDLTPCEQNAFDLHKAFLVAKADAYALRSARAFEDAAKFARQATRGLFLLHGACATAVLATGRVTSMKFILVLLGVGALSSVLSSCFSFFLHRKIAEYNNRYNEIFLKVYLERIQKTVLPNSKLSHEELESLPVYEFTKSRYYYAMIAFGVLSIILFSVVLGCFFFDV